MIQALLSVGKRNLTHSFVVFACLAAVFAFGLTQLKSEPARLAEVNTIQDMYISRSHPDNSVNEVIRAVALTDPIHLPLYHVSLNLWMRYTGRDLFTIRLFSLLTGILTIASTYRLAIVIAGRAVAIDAVLLISFLAFFVFYAHHARMYALLALLTAWVVYAYWRLLVSDESSLRRRWLSLVASSALIVYTHYFAFFIMAGLGLYHLFIAPKNRRWWQVCAAFVVAGFIYLPWLPYTLSYLRIRSIPSADALQLGGAFAALMSIYSNGLPIVLVVATATLILRLRQLKRSVRYIVLLCLIVLTLLLVGNEFSALIIAWRIRYTIALSILTVCILAIWLNLLPRWNILRWPFMALWFVSFVIYWRSDQLYFYTNQFDQEFDEVPHFQDLLYEPSIQPRPGDFILSFHIDTPLNKNKMLNYYGNKTGNWRGLIHIWNDADGDPRFRSTDTRYVDLPSMAIWNFPLWLIHNPRETDLSAMTAFSNNFSNQFHSCGRFLETEESVVDLYVKRSMPCELLVSQKPVEIQYDGGTELANILLRNIESELRVYSWWTSTVANQYAFSLQLFDAGGVKVAQLDDVIGGDALYQQSLYVGALPPAEYVAKLIVYDFTTLQSQSGILKDSQMSFEREVEVARISIGS